MERTVHDFNQWMTDWPPSHAKKVFEGPEASHYVGIGMSMMLHLKTQARLGKIQTNKMIKILPDGTLVMASICFGNDRITVIRPELQEEIFKLPSNYINLFLVFTVSDFRLFLIDLISSKSLEIPDSAKFWQDENFYQGPWIADGSEDGGFGSGTSSSLSDFLKSRDPLIINTIDHMKWHIVTDDNWNMAGLVYFPILVLTNVPGAPHYQLGSDYCYDPPDCYSAIIPGASCTLCFACWPFHGILPLTRQSFYIMPDVWVPLLRNAGQEDDAGNFLEYIEWTKKSQVWDRSTVTGTPIVDITGKTNYSLVQSDKTGLKHALKFRESIYMNTSRGSNSTSGTWWNTWNPYTRVYQPCWVDIARGFGGDEAGLWPFWNWLHETPAIGLVNYAGYAQMFFGGNTRNAYGWNMHWLNYDPEDPEAEPVEESVILNDLDENLSIENGQCTYEVATELRVTGACSWQSGVFEDAYADGSYSGKFFFPVATLGNKRFIYFDNNFSGNGDQTGYRFVGQYAYANYADDRCWKIPDCCIAMADLCFGTCPGCAGALPLYKESGHLMIINGSQSHNFTLTQTLKIGKALPGGVIEDIIIATGQHSYNHQFFGETNTGQNVYYDLFWPNSRCGNPPPYNVCNCNYTYGQLLYDLLTTHTETETYSRNITTFEIVDYCSNPKNDDLAFIYKKIVIQHACSTTDNGMETNWVHNGSRLVTWHLYLNINGETHTIDLDPTFTAYRGGGHSGVGNRVYGASLQINDDYLAFSYLEEAWGGLGAHFEDLSGQKNYPGPMNLEDRNVEPFYDWDNVGCIWNPSKYHYGIVSLHTAFPIFKKWEWFIDMPDKKVFTVGLLVNNQEIEERMAA